MTTPVGRRARSTHEPIGGSSSSYGLPVGVGGGKGRTLPGDPSAGRWGREPAGGLGCELVRSPASWVEFPPRLVERTITIPPATTMSTAMRMAITTALGRRRCGGCGVGGAVQYGPVG